MDSEGLSGQNVANSDGNGGAQWRGCGWSQPDGYAVSIRATNITLPMIRENTGWKVTEELTVGGRAAVVYVDSEVDDPEHCLLNLELEGGSLQFSVTNPPSGRKTGAMNTCEITKTLANKVVAIIPGSA